MSLIKRGKRALKERLSLRQELKALEKQEAEEAFRREKAAIAKEEAAKLKRKRAAAKAKGAKKGLKKASRKKRAKRYMLSVFEEYERTHGGPSTRIEYGLSFLPQTPPGYRGRFRPPEYF